MSNSKSTFEQVNNAGRVWSWLRISPVVLIAASMIGLGVGLWLRKDKYHDHHVKATIVELHSPCTRLTEDSTDDDDSKYHCRVTYTYEARGKTYTFTREFRNLSKAWKKSDELDIHYDHKNPSDHKVNYISPKSVGLGVFVVAMSVLCCAILALVLISNIRGLGSLFAFTNLTS